jgi:hypothetical protein
MQYPDVNGKEKLIRRDGACRVSPIAGEVRLHPGRSGLASGSMGWARVRVRAESRTSPEKFVR